MLNWISDHWFELAVIVVLGIGFVQLISLMHDACSTLEAIRDQIKGLRDDVAQPEPAAHDKD